jgi:succinate dehydrogenase / fumarate reductase cytochrome b subunit
MRERPYYLNLLQIRLPIGGWVSILHRASGALLSILVPALLYGLMLSLQSPQGFGQVRDFLGGGLGWLLALLAIWALLHHFLAGLRHLGFDFGWGEGRVRARQTAWLTLGLALGLTVLIAAGSL